MKCPDCSGEGRVFAHINRGPAGSSFGWLNCIRCKATGVVPDEQAAWIEAGKRMRADRLSRDLSYVVHQIIEASTWLRKKHEESKR